MSEIFRIHQLWIQLSCQTQLADMHELLKRFVLFVPSSKKYQNKSFYIMLFFSAWLNLWSSLKFPWQHIITICSSENGFVLSRWPWLVVVKWGPKKFLAKQPEADQLSIKVHISFASNTLPVMSFISQHPMQTKKMASKIYMPVGWAKYIYNMSISYKENWWLWFSNEYLIDSLSFNKT